MEKQIREYLIDEKFFVELLKNSYYQHPIFIEYSAENNNSKVINLDTNRGKYVRNTSLSKILNALQEIGE